MGDRLPIIDMGRKVGAAMPLSVGVLGPHLTQHGLGRGLPLYQVGGGAQYPSITTSPGPRSTSLPSGILIHPAVWPQQTWAENRGWLCPFGGAGSSSNTMCPWPRPTSMPSLLLIHPTVWPEYTNVTSRQDNGPSYSKPFYKRSPKY